jgi:hypothetical protein
VDRKTARKYTEDLSASTSSTKAPRAYTTRVTEFDKFWPEIQSMLELENNLKPYIILEHMLEKHKDAFQPSWQRTLERRISRWRISNGIQKEVTFSQIHKPGDVLAIDFTDLSSLGIRIASELLDSNHLVFHATLTYSNWEYVEFCRSESFEALASGVQNAFHSLGGVTARVRFDSMTAAVNNLSSDREFQPNWRALLDHFGVNGHRINVRSPQENGDCESLHGHFKDYVVQRLLLRGNRNFESLDAWREFLRDCAAARNKKRSAAIMQERELLESLPKQMFPTFTSHESTVKSSCILRIKQNDYCVPSCFIGKKVQLRIYADHIELWYAGRKELDMPRLQGKKNVHLDYRCVIDSLIRKPSAFANYLYRECMFPTMNFRRAFDNACSEQGERRGIKTYLKLLYMAKHISQEAVDSELALALASKTKIDAKAIEAKIKNTPATPGSLSSVDPHIESPELDDYNSLLEHKEVLDEPIEPEPNQYERGTLEATGPIRTGWPFETTSVADDEIYCDAASRSSGTRELELSGVPERTNGPRMLEANGESHLQASEEVIIGTQQNVVRDSMESPTDGRSTADATTANGGVPVQGREHLDVRQARLGEDIIVERVGGTTGSPRSHSMLRAVREIGPTLVTGQAGTETATAAYETWSILGVDYRRLGLCTTEPGRDGSALHVDRRPLREDEYPLEFEPTVFEMGADFQRPDDYCGSDRSLGAPQFDNRAQRIEHSLGRSQGEPREATCSRPSQPIITQWESTKFHWGNIVVAKAEI